MRDPENREDVTRRGLKFLLDFEFLKGDSGQM